jgi:hypothetical protein
MTAVTADRWLHRHRRAQHTIALTTAASYLAAHHTGPLAPAAAATHGYTVAFATSAALFGVGVILAIVLLPSKRRLGELRAAASAPRPPMPWPAQLNLSRRRR